MKRKEPKVTFENDFQREALVENPDGKEVKVTTYYFHCDHGFVAWQQRLPHAVNVEDVKCPYPGCDQILVPGKAPKREGLSVQGHT